MVLLFLILHKIYWKGMLPFRAKYTKAKLFVLLRVF